MLSDRKTAFWVVLTLTVCLFGFFVIIAFFFTPQDVSGASNIPDADTYEALRETIASLRQAVWWATMAAIMLPMIMLLITLAMYLFITGNPTTSSVVKAPQQKRGLFGIGTKAPKVEAATTSDVLDLRYARGEITREQYIAMKADLAAHQASPPAPRL